MSPFPHLVEAEVRRAADLHPPLANHDEALSVFREEVREVETEVYKKPAVRLDADLLTELVQVAAMARRWVECCGLELVLGNRVPQAAHLVTRFLRHEQRPANSDHESLSRLQRLVHRVCEWSAHGGPDLRGCQQDVALALVTVVATCQRWAEDRGLVPLAAPPELPPVAAVTAVPSPEPPEPGAAAQGVEVPAEGEVADAPA